jgi:hypothetical protein
MQFLLEALCALSDNLQHRGSRLVLVAAKSVDVLPRLVREWKVDRVVAQRWWEPFARDRDRRVGERMGGKLELYEGETLLPPGTLRSKAGTPFLHFLFEISELAGPASRPVLALLYDSGRPLPKRGIALRPRPRSAVDPYLGAFVWALKARCSSGKQRNYARPVPISQHRGLLLVAHFPHVRAS